MFEVPRVDHLDKATCAQALVASIEEQRSIGARRLAYAAHWADLHPAREVCRSGPPRDGEDERQVPGRVGVQHRPKDGHIPDRGLHFGGQGTPQVAEYTGVELGVLLEMSTGSAERLLADALDLRHRLPRVWSAVMKGQLDDWKARRVATATRSLTIEQAAWVDGEVLPALTGLPFGRALDVVEAKVIAADPAAHEARRALEASRRYVSKGRRPNPAGLRTLVAQTTAGDVARLDAMIDHLATLMGRAGDQDDHQVRRTKALALLANPALACVYLAKQHGAASADVDEAVGDAVDEADAPPADPPLDEPAASGNPVELAVAFGRELERGGSRLLDRLRGRTVLYVHLAEEALGGHGLPPSVTTGAQVARVEGLGPVALAQLKEWVGSDSVICTPVVDPMGVQAVDRYETPSDLADALRLLQPYEVFPYGTLESGKLDKDHTEAYEDPDDGGPPGQTGLHNLGPLGRTHHRAKTFGGFVLYQPLPGLYLWRIPSGYWYRVDHAGTHALGRDVPEILRQRQLGGGRTEPGTSRLEAAFVQRVDFALAT